MIVFLFQVILIRSPVRSSLLQFLRLNKIDQEQRKLRIWNSCAHSLFPCWWCLSVSQGRWYKEWAPGEVGMKQRWPDLCFVLLGFRIAHKARDTPSYFLAAPCFRSNAVTPFFEWWQRASLPVCHNLVKRYPPRSYNSFWTDFSPVSWRGRMPVRLLLAPEEEPHLENSLCSIDWSMCGQFCEAFSWLMTDVEGPSILRAVQSPGSWPWIV